MRNEGRWLLTGAAILTVAVVGVALVLVLSDDEVDRRVAPAATTTTTIPSTVTTAHDGTGVTIGILCTTPEEASQSLFSGWLATDMTAAKRCATDSAVATLFKTSSAGAQWTFQGCDTSNPAAPTCAFSYEGGGAIMTVNGSEAAGWKVVQVGFVAD